jgi:hypothetical protein
MRKTILFAAALLAGGLVFSGCVFTDGPHPQITNGSVVKCIGACGENEPGIGWGDGIMGTAGPSAYQDENEEGNFFFTNQGTEVLDAGIACYWDMAGGDGNVRVDTIWSPLADEASGCPPYTYQCGWGIWPLNSAFNFCTPQPYDSLPYFCGLGNAQCRGPYAGHTSLPGSTWWNAPPDTRQFGIPYICIDEQQGVSGFANNIRRQPGPECGLCGSGASALQAPPGKTVVCHVPPGNPGNAHTIIVGNAAVPAHLAHGDYLGECSGGGPGEGHEVPAGNAGPTWSTAAAALVDLNIYLIGEGSPWTDDYSSCMRGLCGGSNGAIDRLADVLAANPVDENGMVTVSISKLSAFGESTELNPPLNLQLKMEVVSQGWPAFNYAVDVTQASYHTALEWAAHNVGGEFTGHGLSVELTSGHTVNGTTLAAAVPYKVAFNADRIAQLADDVAEANLESRNLELRVANR